MSFFSHNLLESRWTLAGVLALVVVIGVGASTALRADCGGLVGNPDTSMNWGEDDPEWVQPLAGTASTPLTVGGGVAVSVPYLLLGGLQDNHPLDPVVGVALLPGCLTYEVISTPLQVTSEMFGGTDRSVSRNRSDTGSPAERRNRTPISPPGLGPGSESPSILKGAD